MKFQDPCDLFQNAYPRAAAIPLLDVMAAWPDDKLLTLDNEAHFDMEEVLKQVVGNLLYDLYGKVPKPTFTWDLIETPSGGGDWIDIKNLEWCDLPDDGDEVAPSPQPVAAAKPKRSYGKYPNLVDDLSLLSDKTLILIKNEARRQGARDLFNASRRELRHRAKSS